MDKKQQVEKYFDDLSNDYLKDKYLSTERSFMSVRLEKILYFFDLYFSCNKKKKILDAGCGPGMLLSKLLERGCNVTGIDVSEEMIKLANKRLSKLDSQKSYNLLLSDIEGMPFANNLFDVVITSGVIEYLDSDDRVLREFYRVIRDKGMLIITVTNKHSYNLIFDDVYERFRQNALFLSIMNFISTKILNYGKLKQKKFVLRKHSPLTFKDELLTNGFAIIESTYFYFLPLPHPFNILFPRFSSKIGNYLERLGNTKLGFLGEGYLLICEKK